MKWVEFEPSPARVTLKVDADPRELLSLQIGAPCHVSPPKNSKYDYVRCKYKNSAVTMQVCSSKDGSEHVDPGVQRRTVH